nr:sulfite exporter TauE/SafE family protein [Roseomonas acroporae]
MLVLAAVVAVAAFVQGALGVGFALIMAPLLGVLLPGLMPGALLLLMLPLNAAVAWRERGSLDWGGIRRITVGRVAGAVLGLAVLLAVPAGQLQILVGVATILTALVTLAAPRFEPNRAAFLGAGVVTGVTETATGIGGPPLALVYQHRPAPVLRATVAACFLIGEVLSLALLLGTGRLAWEQAWLAGLLVPPLALGVVLSRRAGARLAGPRFRMLILGFAIVSGVVCLIPTG